MPREETEPFRTSFAAVTLPSGSDNRYPVVERAPVCRFENLGLGAVHAVPVCVGSPVRPSSKQDHPCARYQASFPVVGLGVALKYRGGRRCEPSAFDRHVSDVLYFEDAPIC